MPKSACLQHLDLSMNEFNGFALSDGRNGYGSGNLYSYVAAASPAIGYHTFAEMAMVLLFEASVGVFKVS